MKKTVVKYLLRLMGLTISTIIILFFLNIIFAFYGNPYKLRSSERVIKRYINKHYDINEYKVGKIEYNFKTNSYSVLLRSKKYYDDEFMIYYNYDTKSIVDDEYLERVANKKNTIQRLEKDMEVKINEVLSKSFPYDVYSKIKKVTVILKDGINSPIKDIPLDTNISGLKGYKLKVGITMSKDDDTTFLIARNIRVFNRILFENNIYVDEYSFIYNTFLDALVIPNITADEINRSDFQEILEKEVKKKERYG